MKQTISQSLETYLRETIYLLVTLLLCGVLFVIFLRISGINRNPKAGFEEVLNGRAYKPYVQRVLIPLSVRAILWMLPSPLETNLRQQLNENHTIQQGLAIFNAPKELGLEAILVWILMYSSLVGFCYSFRSILSTIGGLKSPFALDLFSLSTLLPLVLFFGFGYFYDFTTLLLFTLALVWMAARRCTAYLLVFFLACLNKETAILLTLAFFFHFKTQNEISRFRFLTLLALQIACYTLIRIWLFFRFQANPGSLVEVHFAEYQIILQQFPEVGLISLAIFLVILLLVFHHWKQKPLFLRHATVMFPPLLILTMAFGFPYEFRVFYEVYPVFSAMAILSIARLQSG
ncbi:MAG: hypothetical protein ANABAC_2999 [Anaerolineae bacterium]|jgi:hypothetical protein|nr:MAG: hypothetical protein ANABAC_2999 [Anaerolineae bacterium]